MINRVVCIFIFSLFFDCTSNQSIKELPIYGNKEFLKGLDTDTIFHTIPQWSFINQFGKAVSSDAYKGKIYVVDFFFSHCPTICPAMTMNLVKLQQLSIDLDIELISFTVDPKKDSSERLFWYQNAFGINGDNWNLLTGNQSAIYELGVNGFLVPNQEDALAPGGFLHSEKIMLIDKKGRIRGYYDGTDEDQISLIFEDIVILKQE